MAKNKYVLLAGYRRFNACKKLGWTKIKAEIRNEDKIEMLNMDDIDLGNNSRKDEQSSELNDLMASIKQNGLIQAVVVAKASDLTEEDFVTLNLTENVIRKDLTPLEIAYRLQRLVKLGLTKGEVAVRMGLPLSRVNDLILMSNRIDEKHLKKVEFTQDGIIPSKKGKLSYTVANSLAKSNMSNTLRNQIIEAVTKDGLTVERTDMVVKLVHSGMTVSQAIKASVNYTRLHVNFIVRTDKLDELKDKHKGSFTTIVLKMLEGKIPFDKKLIFTADSS